MANEIDMKTLEEQIALLEELGVIGSDVKIALIWFRIAKALGLIDLAINIIKPVIEENTVGK